MAASAVSAIPEVREFLLEIQRRTARENSVIMDGRDIGTFVLPNAELKIFLTASVDERAMRRHKELIEKGDKKRRAYHDYYATTHWGEAQSYHLCVNSSLMGIDNTVDFLHSFIKARFGL